MHEEMWQEYDKSGNPLSTAGRLSTLLNPSKEKGDKNYVATTGVWLYIFSEETTENPTGIYILAQQRSMTVDENQGLWDVSAGGHINKGETIKEGFVRETMEEIGYALDPKKLRIIREKRVDEPIMKFSYTGIYHFEDVNPSDVTAFKFDDNEVSQVKWIPLSDFDNFIENNAKPILKKDTETRKMVLYLVQEERKKWKSSHRISTNKTL